VLMPPGFRKTSHLSTIFPIFQEREKRATWAAAFNNPDGNEKLVVSANNGLADRG